MNKILITILLIAIVVLSGCATTTTTTDGNKTITEIDGTIADSDNGELINIEGKNSIENLMKSEKALHCTFSQESDETGEAFSQETYMDGNKLYVEMTMDTEVDVTVYTIDDGEYTYTWYSNSDKGIKTKTMDEEYIDDDEEFNGEESGEYDIQEEDEDGVEMDLELDYNCEAWKAKNSQFVPPKNIEFVDLASMMEGLEGLAGLFGE